MRESDEQSHGTKIASARHPLFGVSRADLRAALRAYLGVDPIGPAFGFWFWWVMMRSWPAHIANSEPEKAKLFRYGHDPGLGPRGVMQPLQAATTKGRGRPTETMLDRSSALLIETFELNGWRPLDPLSFAGLEALHRLDQGDAETSRWPGTWPLDKHKAAALAERMIKRSRKRLERGLAFSIAQKASRAVAL